jgi:HlyD family secretion protein
VKLNKKNILIILLLLAGIGIFAAFEMKGKAPTQYYTAKVDHGDIRQVVDATGTINAVTTVQVGSQVSGTINKLFVDFNSHVKKGQVIAQIDPSLFEATVSQAQADLENARANLAASHANTEKAKATAIQTKADYDRNLALTKEGVVSQQALDLAKANSDSAQAQVSAAVAQEGQARAQVAQKEAAVKVAQTNLNYTTIHAPIDGTVVARNVDVGQTVAASLQAPTLFTIAQDLTKMQVYAKTDESDVGQIRPGQRVSFKVDAYPRDTFSGKVSQVRMNSTVVQNVVTYDTIVDFDNPDLKLFPGMTAYVTIPVASATNVIKIPNGALRYKPDLPPNELSALYKKYGIPGEGGGGQRAARAGGQRGQGGPGGPGGQGAANAGGTQQANAGNGSNPAAGANGAAASGGPGQGGFGGRRGMQPGGGDQESAAAGSSDVQGPKYDTSVIWKLLPDKTIEPVRVKTGITDHTFTELVQELNGNIQAGDELVTGAAQSRGGSSGPPRMGGPGGGGPGGGGPRGGGR